MLALALTVLLAQSAPDRAEARRLFERGEALFAKGQLAQAQETFEASFRVLPLAATAFNLARCTQAQDRPADAIGWYRRYLRLDPAASDRTEVQAALRAQEKRLRARSRQALTIFASPAASSVSVDGQVLGGDGVTVAVNPGTHRVLVTAPGHASATLDVELAADVSQAVFVSLEVVPAPPAPAPVVAEPNAEAWAPPPSAPPPPPHGALEPSAASPTPVHAADAPVAVSLPPPRLDVKTPGEHAPAKARPWSNRAGVATAALGVVALGLGAGSWVASSQLRDGTIRDQPSAQGLRQTTDGLAFAANVAWASAGAAAVATAVLYLVER